MLILKGGLIYTVKQLTVANYKKNQKNTKKV